MNSKLIPTVKCFLLIWDGNLKHRVCWPPATPHKKQALQSAGFWPANERQLPSFQTQGAHGRSLDLELVEGHTESNCGDCVIREIRKP